MRRLPAATALDGALVAAGSLLLLLTPRNFAGDGYTRYQATLSLAAGHWPREKYSLVVPALALPLHWLGELVGSERAVVYRFNGLVLAAGLLGFGLLLRRRSSRVARTFLLLVVFASMFATNVTTMNGETFTAIGLGVGLLAAVSGGRRTQAAGWALAVLATINTPAVVPAMGLAVLLQAVRTRRWRLLLLVPVVLALCALDVRLHTGSFTSPYADDMGFRTVLPYSGLPNFSYPAVLGVAAILFSFGKGLIFFAPGLFLSVKGRLRAVPPVYPLWIAVVVGLVAVYCRWWAWYGGFVWGPRFFLFASLPAALALAVRLRTPAASVPSALVTLGVLALSTWVAISACIGAVGQELCRAGNFSREYLCWYAPEFSVLWQPFVHWPHQTAAQLGYELLAVVTFLRLAVPYAARELRGRSWSVA